MRVSLGWRRGTDGRFCREIPGFLGGARVRRDGSAHGGHCRANWAKKFLKIFKKRGGKPKNWGARDAGRRSEGTLYRVRGVIFRSGNEASSSVARGALRAGASTTGARHEISEIRSSLYIEGMFASSIAHSIETSPLVRPTIPQPSPVA